MAQLYELAEHQSEFPITFSCPTGELVFGQTHCVLEGLRSSAHVKQGVPFSRPNQLHGTSYRVAARPGTWKVARIFSSRVKRIRGVFHESKDMIGYVVHHESISASDYLKRASFVGVNPDGYKVDGQIVSVNRDDWSQKHGSRSVINSALYPQRPWTIEQVNSLMGGRFTVMDPSYGGKFIDMLQSSFLERQCYLFSDVASQDNFGAQLVTQPLSEHELGWIGFSGQKHPTFPDSDEVVAFIYDGVNNGLDLPKPKYKLFAEDVLARSGNEATPLRANTVGVESDDEDYDPVASSDNEMEVDGDSDEEEEVDSMDEDEDADISKGEILALREDPILIPEPTIFSTSPIWGQGVNLYGTMFMFAKTVYVKQTSTPFIVASNDHLQVRIPPGLSGLLDIVVETPVGISDVQRHRHKSDPIIDRIEPKSGSKWGGTILSIHGKHLSGVDTVFFGPGEEQAGVSVERISASLLRVIVPASIDDNSKVEVKLQKTDSSRPTSGKLYDLCAPNPEATWFRYDDIPPLDGYGAAVTTFTHILQRNPAAFDARKRLSAVYELMDNNTPRIDLWEEVSANEDGRIGDVLCQLGAAYAINGNYERAIEVWEKALKAGADHMDLFIGMSEAYSRTGNGLKAAEMKLEGDRLWAST